MNKWKVLATMLLALAVIVVMAVPNVAASSDATDEGTSNIQIGVDGITLPKEINGHRVPTKVMGYPVVFVETAETGPYYVGPPKIIVYAKEMTWDGVSEPPVVAPKDWPENWAIEVFGGGDPMSVREAARLIEKDKLEISKMRGRSVGGSDHKIHIRAIEGLETDSSVAAHSTFPNTFAVVQNADVGSYIVNGQMVRIAAPTVGREQDGDGSLMFVNGMTNQGWFLQCGMEFCGKGFEQGQWNGRGFIGYTSTTWGNAFQYFSSVPYYAGHTYDFMILYYNSQPDGWYYSAYDRSNGRYDYVIDYAANGNRLTSDIQTSVFFENYNSDVDWCDGFTNPVRAWHALQSLSGVGWTYWYNEYKWTVDAEGIARPASEAQISGHLTSGSIAEWYLNHLPRPY